MHKGILYGIFFLVSLQVSAQQLIGESQKVQQLTLVSGKKTEFARNTDYMLYTLASSSQKKQKDLHFQVSMVSHFKVIRKEGQSVEIQLGLPAVSTTGDTKYRGFEITAFMTPDLFSGSYSLRLNGNNELLRNFTDVRIEENSPARLALYEGDNFLQETSIMGQISNIGYSTAAVKRFDQQIRRINNYWAAVNLVDSVMRRMNREGVAEQNQVDILFNYWDVCRKVNKQCLDIIRSDEPRVSNTDPGNLIVAYDKLFRMQTRLKTLLLAVIEKNGVEQEKAGDFVAALISALDGFRYNSLHIDYLDSELFYNTGRIVADEEFKQLFVSIDQHYFGRSAGQLIYAALVSKGDSLRQRDDLTHALDYYEDAISLYQKLPYVREDKSMMANRQLVKEGIFKSFVQIAEKSLTVDNYTMADSYINKAIDFQQLRLGKDYDWNIESAVAPFIRLYCDKGNNLLEYNRFNEAVALFNRIENYLNALNAIPQSYPGLQLGLQRAHKGVFMGFVNTADEYFKKGDITNADAYADYARQYRNEHLAYLENATEADALKRSIQQPVFNQAIDRGVIAFQKGNAGEALATFNIARDLAGSFNLNFKQPLDSLTLTAAKPVIIQKIQSANIKVWANELDAAWKIYEEAGDLQKTYSLEGDNDIKAAFAALDRKIIDRICLNNKLSYDELMLQADRALRFERFDELRKKITEALTLTNENPGCGIDAQKALLYQEQYKLVFSYFERYNAVMKQMFEQGFAAAIGNYVKLDQEIEQYHLSDLNQTHMRVIDFLENQKNSSLTFTALSWYTQKAMKYEAIRCLRLLKDLGEDEKNTKQAQAELGAMVAKEDLRGGARVVIEEKLDAYVGSDRWFRSFRKAYEDSINTHNK
ncbi:MAG: hypothetical protein KKD74_12495 [Bacteroidetes bacterium]|nr:hypothetical protein [Bacteroidota bacterium]